VKKNVVSRKEAFKWLKLEGLWSYHLGDIGQKVQLVQTGIVSAALGK